MKDTEKDLITLDGKIKAVTFALWEWNKNYPDDKGVTPIGLREVIVHLEGLKNATT